MAAFRWGRESALKENAAVLDLSCFTAAALLGLPAARFCVFCTGDGGSSVVDGILWADVAAGIHGCIRPSATALQIATTISGHLRNQTSIVFELIKAKFHYATWSQTGCTTFFCSKTGHRQGSRPGWSSGIDEYLFLYKLSFDSVRLIDNSIAVTCDCGNKSTFMFMSKC